jgi:hypothetical protein
VSKFVAVAAASAPPRSRAIVAQRAGFDNVERGVLEISVDRQRAPRAEPVTGGQVEIVVAISDGDSVAHVVTMN